MSGFYSHPSIHMSGTDYHLCIYIYRSGFDSHPNIHKSGFDSPLVYITVLLITTLVYTGVVLIPTLVYIRVVLITTLVYTGVVLIPTLVHKSGTRGESVPLYIRVVLIPP